MGKTNSPTTTSSVSLFMSDVLCGNYISTISFEAGIYKTAKITYGCSKYADISVVSSSKTIESFSYTQYVTGTRTITYDVDKQDTYITARFDNINCSGNNIGGPFATFQLFK